MYKLFILLYIFDCFYKWKINELELELELENYRVTVDYRMIIKNLRVSKHAKCYECLQYINVYDNSN